MENEEEKKNKRYERCREGEGREGLREGKLGKEGRKSAGG